ncbi:MAG: hypothetical protein PUC00_02500 [Clostridiales bacterium]|nr:hypothetical protein [Clostridiales bacterium]
MRRKNVLEYLMLGLFIMCMGLALSATLEYNTRATEREYLLQGVYLLSITGMMLGSFLCVRVIHRVAPRIPARLSNALWLLACTAVFGAGLYLRLRVIHGIVLEPESDFETYYRIANHLLNDTMLTPEAEVDRRYIAQYPHTIGFPMLVLVPVFKLLGVSVSNALYANLVCSMVSVLLVGHMAYRTMGKAASVMGMTLMSLWPSHILYGTMVATEPSYTMLSLLTLDLMVCEMQRGRNSLYTVSPFRALVYLPLIGVACGLAGAIRPTAMLLLAAWAVVRMMIGGDPEGKITAAGIRTVLSKGWLCVLVVGIFYWGTGFVINSTIRDIIMEKPASGLMASGYNMMVGLNAEHKGIWNQEDAEFFAAAYEQTGSASQAHEAAMQRAIQRIQSEPENVMNLMVYKFRDLWQTDDFGIDWNLLWAGQQGTLTQELSAALETVRTYSRPVYMAVLVLSMLGALEAWRRRRAPMPLQMLAILYFLASALSHMLLETQVRYHYSIIPILILLSVICLYEWREHAAEEPPVRIVYQKVPSENQDQMDYTHFDMASALAQGHIHMTVSAAYTEDGKRAEEIRSAAEASAPEAATSDPAVEDAKQAEEIRSAAEAPAPEASAPEAATPDPAVEDANQAEEIRSAAEAAAPEGVEPEAAAPDLAVEDAKRAEEIRSAAEAPAPETVEPEADVPDPAVEDAKRAEEIRSAAEAAAPETVEPEAAAPDLAVEDAKRAEEIRSAAEAAAPETVEPEAAAPDPAVEDANWAEEIRSAAEAPAPEATAPEATAPEATVPEATAPEASALEAAAPEAAAPEATVPEATAPEATLRRKQLCQKQLCRKQLRRKQLCQKQLRRKQLRRRQLRRKRLRQKQRHLKNLRLILPQRTI